MTQRGRGGQRRRPSGVPSAHDPLAARHDRIPVPSLDPADTALLLIDLQYGDADRRYGLLARLAAAGEHDLVNQICTRLDLAIGNCERLLAAARAASVEVVHTRICSLTPDGRDRSREHKVLGIHFPPGSTEATLLPRVAEGQGEIVLDKTCSSPFAGTIIHQLLLNLGKTTLVIAGVATAGCVDTTARDAADRGFAVIVVGDACADWSTARHEAALSALHGSYAVVRSTADVLSQLAAVVPPTARPSRT